MVNHERGRRYVPGMRSLLRYETRLCGPAVLAVPPLAGISIGVATSLSGPSWHRLLAGEVLPVLLALPAAATAGGDPARELQATVPRRYVWTVATRLLVMGGMILSGVGLAAVLGAVFGGVVDVLGFAASASCSALLLVGVGVAVGVSSSSTAAASSVVLALWLGLLLVGERVLGEGAARLLVPACLGCAALALALHRLDSAETESDVRLAQVGS